MKTILYSLIRILRYVCGISTVLLLVNGIRYNTFKVPVGLMCVTVVLFVITHFIIKIHSDARTEKPISFVFKHKKLFNVLTGVLFALLGILWVCPSVAATTQFTGAEDNLRTILGIDNSTLTVMFSMPGYVVYILTAAATATATATKDVTVTYNVLKWCTFACAAIYGYVSHQTDILNHQEVSDEDNSVSRK